MLYSIRVDKWLYLGVGICINSGVYASKNDNYSCVCVCVIIKVRSIMNTITIFIVVCII